MYFGAWCCGPFAPIFVAREKRNDKEVCTLREDAAGTVLMTVAVFAVEHRESKWVLSCPRATCD